MDHFVLCVKDNCAGVYMRPFTSPNTGSAIRTFSSEINRPAEDNMMYKHADDFDLYLLGMFDDATGELRQETPKCLIRGKDVVLQTKPQH